MTVALYAPAASSVAVGGTSVVAAWGPLLGGRIDNPASAGDQGLAAPETLYVSFVGPATLSADGTTFAVEPGGSISFPAGLTSDVWVNAASSHHAFSAFVTQAAAGFVPSTSTFPPPGPTSVTRAIPAYLYTEYNDDEDLAAFIAWFNSEEQKEVDWFNFISLPIYTSPSIAGALLDWVAAGLYGFPERPALPSGSNQNVGEFNTYDFDEIALNDEVVIGNQNFYATTDDVFKRILTWHLYKGDGKVFNVRWLKRRIMRFLFGANGTDAAVAYTYPVSINFTPPNGVQIVIGRGLRIAMGGAIFDESAFGEAAFDDVETTFIPSPAIPMALIFKSAIEAGVLEFPFQFTPVISVG